MQNFSNEMQMDRHLLYFLHAEKEQIISYLTHLHFFILIFYSIHSARRVVREFKRCTHGAAALVRFVTKAASLSAEKRRAAGGGRLALAECAIVLVHDETSFAVQVAFHLGTNPLVVRRVQGGVVRRRITRRRLTGAHRAAVLVLDEVTVEPTMRQFRANFVILRQHIRQHIRHEVDLLQETRVVSFAGRQKLTAASRARSGDRRNSSYPRTLRDNFEKKSPPAAGTLSEIRETVSLPSR